MKIIRWIAILDCIVLFVAGLLVRVDGIDAHECRSIAAILFMLSFFAAPVMCLMEFLARCLGKWVTRIIYGRGVPARPFRSVPSWLWVAGGAACLSFALGASVGAIWKGSASLWAGLVAAGFGCGLLLGCGLCVAWERNAVQRKETAFVQNR